MRLLPALAFLALAAPAAAQTITAAPQLYDRSPWWMREPVLASLGEVRAEVPANRASLGASYEAIDKSPADATRAAADRVRPLANALAAYGAEKVRVSFTFNTRPLYAQYKDKEGNIQENQRGDKVDRYQVTASVTAQVRDLKLTERVYATLLAAKPTSTQPVYFSLQPDNALNDAMLKEATADAARRARAAAGDTGARLGAVKLIDPTGRACSTDVLVAGAPRSFGSGGYATDVSEVIVTGSRIARGAMDVPPPPPLPIPPTPAPVSQSVGPADAVLQPEAMQLPLQTPLQEIRRQACVVYALGGGVSP